MYMMLSLWAWIVSGSELLLMMLLRWVVMPARPGPADARAALAVGPPPCANG